MKPILAACGLFILILVTTVAVHADIAKPKPTVAHIPAETKSVNTRLEIVPDAKATDARLQIRQSDINELRAALNSTGTNSTFAASITRSTPRTIIAGFLLFLSVSFAGVWLARASRSSAGLRRAHKLVAIALITVATLGAAALIVRGNAGPPPGFRWRNLPAALAAGQSTSGPVIIEVVPDDASPGGTKLIIPLKKQNAQGEDEE